MYTYVYMYMYRYVHVCVFVYVYLWEFVCLYAFHQFVVLSEIEFKKENERQDLYKLACFAYVLILFLARTKSNDAMPTSIEILHSGNR